MNNMSIYEPLNNHSARTEFKHSGSLNTGQKFSTQKSAYTQQSSGTIMKLMYLRNFSCSQKFFSGRQGAHWNAVTDPCSVSFNLKENKHNTYFESDRQMSLSDNCRTVKNPVSPQTIITLSKFVYNTCLHVKISNLVKAAMPYNLYQWKICI